MRLDEPPHRADWAVRVSNHAHIVTSSFHHVTRKLTTIVTVVDYHDSHVEVEI